MFKKETNVIRNKFYSRSLVIDIVFRCFGVYLSFNKKPTAELGKRNSWMTIVAEEGNPGYGWFCFPVLSDRQRNLYYAKN